MVKSILNFCPDEVLDEFEVDEVTSLRVYLPFDPYLKGVVMAVEIRVVAFAENCIVFFVRPVGSVQTVRRIEGRSSTYFHQLLLWFFLSVGRVKFETKR